MRIRSIWKQSMPMIAAVTLLLLTGCAKKEAAMTAVDTLKKQIDRFALTEVTGDTTVLSEGDRLALRKLIAAARVMDDIFMNQIWSGESALAVTLASDTSELGKMRFRYFEINGAPWSRLDNDSAFLTGIPPFPPPGANFYPEDMTKEEFEQWYKGLPANQQEQAKGFFTIIRRRPDKTLTIIPYSEAYAANLRKAAGLLHEAAALTGNASLKNFLLKRADAFLSNDYYASDVAWMDIDAPIDVTIGPYETYQDKVFGYKATFEAFITLRDEQESAALKKFSGYLQELENHLPENPAYRNPKLGAASPIRVVDEVFTGGDTRGVQTAAFNLPNDDKVVKEKGSKRVMLKNVQEAKFNQVLIPISRVVLDTSQQQDVQFEPFFTHILAHELMHGLGPHNITVGGKPETVRTSLQELFSAIEEAKADITGLWALQYLIDKGALDRSMEQTMYTTYLASMFRSVRFGINEAHGKGTALQFNYLMKKGGIVYSPAAGTFRIDIPRMKDAVRSLTEELLTLEAEGNKGTAGSLLETYAHLGPEMQQALTKLKNIPVDIAPVFPIGK